GDEVATAVRMDSQGNTYVAGTYTEPFSFGGVGCSGSGSNLFVIQLNAAFQAVRALCSTGTAPVTQAVKLAIDPADNVFVAGTFGQGTFGFETAELSNDDANDDAFVALFAPSGEQLAARQLSAVGGDVRLRAITSDACGSAVAGGGVNSGVEIRATGHAPAPLLGGAAGF